LDIIGEKRAVVGMAGIVWGDVDTSEHKSGARDLRLETALVSGRDSRAVSQIE